MVDLQRRLSASPDIVSHVRVLGAAPRTATGGAALGAIYAGKQWVVVTTKAVEEYALWLPGDCAAKLAEAFAPSFEQLQAVAEARLK